MMSATQRHATSGGAGGVALGGARRLVLRSERTALGPVRTRLIAAFSRDAPDRSAVVSVNVIKPVLAPCRRDEVPPEVCRLTHREARQVYRLRLRQNKWRLAGKRFGTQHYSPAVARECR